MSKMLVTVERALAIRDYVTQVICSQLADTDESECEGLAEALLRADLIDVAAVLERFDTEPDTEDDASVLS